MDALILSGHRYSICAVYSLIHIRPDFKHDSQYSGPY